MKRTYLTLGVFGFGCVGQGLYHVLSETEGFKATIKKFCIKHPDKKRILPDSYFTTEASVLLQDPDINVIVELIDDADAAFAILKEALQNGKAVVTANKKMIAEHFDEIYELQKKYQLPVLYESAVCASIPIIRNLEEYYDNDLIQSVEGIFNGSTNYILTKIFEENLSYETALQQAQQLGFAETDPTLDVQGFDPKYKLSIVMAHAFGVFIKPENIIHSGIDLLTADEFEFARQQKWTIKLVASAFKVKGEIFGLVCPQYIAADHLLANVKNEYNAVIVEGAFSEKQLFVGKGAGGYPTGSAVLSDLSALSYGYKYEYKKRTQHAPYPFSNQAQVAVWVSTSDASLLADSFVQEERRTIGKTIFAKGTITLQALQQLCRQPKCRILRTIDSKITAEKAVVEKALV